MQKMRKCVGTALALGVAVGALGIAGCGGGDGGGQTQASTTTSTSSGGTTTAASAPTAALPTGAEHVKIDPADFTTEIDNPYLPLAPGDHWVYREVENGKTSRIDVTVTNATKVVGNGVEARVIHDVGSKNGQPLEDTHDWYAQDSTGNVWYMGEQTAEYKNGKVTSRAGSWEAGVDGAEPGVVMPADPKPGQSYREELYNGQAEDKARITGNDAKVTVPFGSYGHVVTTTNTTPLEPNVLEHKFYARGVGSVREDLLSGGHGRTELLRFTQGG
jgi:hypothetical protein